MPETIKIYGYGWVGKAVQDIFPEAILHDPELGLRNTEAADVAFVCVPTPNYDKGELDTSIVEQVVANAEENLIIIRSTVNPGTCDKLTKKYPKKHIVFMPEYLGETIQHPLLDESARKFLIIGGKPKDRRKVIELFQGVYNANITIRQVTNLEAEVIKLSENRAIAFKVLQCQELYDACEAAGVDYYTVRDAVYGDDPRFNLWFTFIYPEARGASSKCIPKDVYAWQVWAENAGAFPGLTEDLLSYNEGLLNVKYNNPE